MTRPAPDPTAANRRPADVTAPAHPDRQGTREELATALRGHSFRGDWNLGLVCRCGEWSGPSIVAARAHVADALLPVVERLCDQRAAEALEEAADGARWVATIGGIYIPADALRDRAAALATGTREGQP